MSSKYASDKLSFSSYSKVNAFFKVVTFRFVVQRKLTLKPLQFYLRQCYVRLHNIIYVS